MMYVNIHKGDHSDVIAVCDEDLIGKLVSDENSELNISEKFYKGRLLNEEEVLEILNGATNVNLVGDEAIGCGIKCGLIDEDEIVVIVGIKFAQFYSLE